jgi:hypothetical protein
MNKKIKKIRSYKNLWSINTEEAIVAGILRAETKKDVEVFIPLNAQMKDIDLILVNTKNKKIKTIQVKGSKAFEKCNKKPLKDKDYSYGSFGWIDVKKNVIDNEKSIADYFIFLIYVIEQFNKSDKRKILIKPHTITIPKIELKKKLDKYKKTSSKGIYRFHIWINPKTNKAFDFINFKDKTIEKKEYYTKFLDEKGLLRLKNELI